MNLQTSLGETALMFAIEKGHNEIARLLIENGADIDAQDKYQRTALMRASARGNTDMVALLVENGADVNVKDQKDLSALDIAIKFAHDDIVSLLPKPQTDSVDTDSTAFKLGSAPDSTMMAAYDTPPKPKGGLEAIQDKLKYPKKAQKAGVEGIVNVKVLVGTNGKVLETEIEKSFDEISCDMAAIDAIKKIKWEPAKKDDEPIEAWISVPVEFKLDD